MIQVLLSKLSVQRGRIAVGVLEVHAVRVERLELGGERLEQVVRVVVYRILPLLISRLRLLR